MYNKRLKIFALFCGLFALICVIRLGCIQLNSRSVWQGQLEKIRTGANKILPALRGRILDRNGTVLAIDEARFALCIDYKYAKLADERFWQGQLQRDIRKYGESDDLAEKIRAEYADDFNELNKIILKCAEFTNQTFEQIKTQINEQINEPIWQLRFYLAWKRKCPTQKFEIAYPVENDRLLLASDIDVAEMHYSQELFKFENDDEVLAAQLKFIDTPGIEIRSGSERIYPYKNSAAALIGWVRPANPTDNENFADNEELRYMTGEITGLCGIEYVCEPFLRGKRGKIVYNIDNEITSKTETTFGSDVKLTIDIDLQQKIEGSLKDPARNPKLGQPAAVVVVDVNSTDILAYISLPDYDLNTARRNYSKLLAEANSPIIDRVINSHYPPGSSAKPVMLAAALAERKIIPDEIISCPSTPAPKGWPRCLIERTSGTGHDQKWADEGGNKARNALKGSCNCYFSHLAARIPPPDLQRWLYDFGFGRTALLLTDEKILASFADRPARQFIQTAGIISSGTLNTQDIVLEQRPAIDSAERRFFGIGQGNFRATPLQVANAFAALARGGIFKRSRIITSQQPDCGFETGLNRQILAPVYEGMYAVVNEQGGTAHNQFADSGFEYKGIKVFGKTGSTERPFNAWFAGFAEDSAGRTIAFAVLIENGASGSKDAGPIARDIVAFLIETGYLKEN
ncbi:MAG: penicillin-binding transpeptidase domain-containing protein [Phycisphaerae bacterium]|jgi:cell division protein FtsI/penicillin-binding protein 2